MRVRPQMRFSSAESEENCNELCACVMLVYQSRLFCSPASNGAASGLVAAWFEDVDRLLVV